MHSAEEVLVGLCERSRIVVVDGPIRNRPFRPGFLRVDYFLEERLFRLRGENAIPGRELRGKDRIWSLDDLHAALLDLLEILRIAVMRPRKIVSCCG